MKISFATIVSIILCAVNYGQTQDTLFLKPYFKDLRLVDVSINNTNYKFLFDTGGGETFISKNIADTLHKNIYGKVNGIRMSGEQLNYQKADSITLKAGKTLLFHSAIGVWNVMDVLPKELPAVDGILSLKSFQNRILTIDLRSNILIIETEGSFNQKKPEMKALPSRFVNGLNGNEQNILLGITSNRHVYWFLFDTGNIGPAIMNNGIIDFISLAPPKSDSTKSEFPAIIQCGDLQLKTNARLDAVLYDGVLNYQALEQKIFTIDFKSETMWEGERK